MPYIRAAVWYTVYPPYVSRTQSVLAPFLIGSLGNQCNLHCRYNFLLEALADLDGSLRKLGSRLFIAQGKPEEVLPVSFKLPACVDACRAVMRQRPL